jgi:hypothetical protein
MNSGDRHGRQKGNPSKRKEFLVACLASVKKVREGK